MTLSNDLISQFVQITKSDTKTKSDVTRYGTVKITDGKTYVMLDGAEILTPITTVASVKDGDRVTVQIKDHAATITGNLSSPSANSTDLALVDKKIAEFETVIAKSITTEQLNAERARIDELIAKDVIIEGKLTANEATINRLSSTMITTETLRAEIAQIGIATIEDLNAINAKIYNLEGVYGTFEALTTGRLDALEGRFDTLEADFATVEYLEANYATIDKLDAVSGNINILTSDVADINTLIFGSASGNVIHSNFANAVVAQLGNAQIKSAMIESIAADKITAGDIITNNVKVMSEDGSLVISDETMQISDENRVRVQIGKDAAGDYSINIWDESGNLMFSKGGITDNAIKKAIIRNDMVSDNANISAGKLDIDSLFKVINEDGSHTLKSSKILLDDEGQTLNIAFEQITTNVDKLQSDISSQGTDISVIQGQINQKIWKQDITTAVEGGARNLILNSGFSKDLSNWFVTNNTMTYLSDGGYNGGGIQITITSGNSGTVTPRQTTNFKFKNGDTLICSVKVKTISGTWGTTSYVRWASLFTIPYLYHKALDNGWYLYVYRVTLDSDLTITSANPFGFGGFTEGTFIIDEIKLEKGTIATDWTPAPEDLEGEVQNLTTQYSELNQDLNEISATVVKHESDISGTKSQLTEVVANLDGFKSEVSKTYTTKSAFDALEIGGRNLFKGYGEEEIRLADYRGVGSFSQFKDCLTFNPCETVGETYTISFWAKSPNGPTTLSVYNSNSNPRHFYFHTGSLWTLNAEWQYIKFTFYNSDRGSSYSDDNCNRLEFYAASQMGVLVKKIKVEKGNKATDWSPAPEDIVSESVTKAEASFAVTADAIRSEVSNIDGRLTIVEQTAEDFTVRIGNTENELANLEIGGRNYFRNSDFKSTYVQAPEISKHENLYPNHWDGYNGGIDNPTTSYHAHVDQDTFGRNVIEFNESDGSRNRKAIQQSMTNIDSYKKNWRISVDVYATGTGTYIHGGFYCYLVGSTSKQFHAGLFYIYPTKVNEWERLSVEVKMPADIDLSRDVGFYIYGYGFSTNSILYIANPSLNISTNTTDWTPAPEDVNSSISAVDTKATNAQSTANTASGKADTAQSTADAAKTAASNAQSTANTATTKANNAQSTANTAKANAATAQNTATNAAKTATNYLNFSQNGLIIGDHTASSLGRNILVGSEYIDFRNNDIVLARYGADKIQLGLSNNTNASVSFCDDEFIFGYDTDYSMWSVKSKNELIIQAPTELSLLSYARASYNTSSMCEINMTTHDGLTPLLSLCTTDQINNDITHSCINIGGDYIDMYGVAGSNTVQITLLPFQNRINILSGSIDSTAEYITTNPTGFRIAYGSYGSFIRNDGDSTYFLLTNSGDIYGNWNNLRPLAIKNSTGNISMGHNLSVSGTISEGGTALSSKYSPLSHNHDDRYYTSGSHMHASSLTIGTSDPLIYCDDGQHLRFRWLSGGAYRYMAMEDLYNLGWGYTSSSGINSNASTFNINTSANRNGVTVSGNFRPKVDDNMSCGTSGYKWTKLYSTSGSIGTSDEREKDILSNASLEDYSDLFMDIKPIIFRWKSGSDKQIYFGVGAQTLERQFKEHGFDPSLYGIIEHDELEEPTALGLTDRYGMNYQNLQMLTLMQTQKNTRELKEKDAIITNLKAQVETLWDIVMQMYHESYVLKNTTH